MKVAHEYIGVTDGYLGDFSYRTHAEFYPLFCNLDIDPNKLPGTTRERFISILSNASPADQAKILRGVLERFPVNAEDAPATRTAEAQQRIERMIASLLDSPSIESPDLEVSSDTVVRALAETETLIETQGATSGVDRVHTALHGYLKAICAEADLDVAKNASLTELYKTLRKEHPALQPTGPRASDIDAVLKAFANILDKLNPLRNEGSMAHPQDQLLEQPEAMLVIHAARTVLHYLKARLRSDERQDHGAKG
jgi:hypothetical protein